MPVPKASAAAPAAAKPSMPARPPAPAAKAPAATGGAEEPKDTLEQFRRADGTWEPERAQLHETIIGKFLDHVQPAAPEIRTGVFNAGDKLRQDWFEHVESLVPRDRVAVFLMGSPAAGKTTLSRKMYGESFVRVDPDAVKEHLPEYDPKAPMHVHEESSYLAKEILARAVRKGCHFIKDGTGANASKMVDQIAAAKAAGYTVVLNYIRSSEALAQQRNAARERVVPKDIVHQIYQQVAHAFGKVKPAADYVQVFESHAAGWFKLLKAEKLAKALSWMVGRPVAFLRKTLDGGFQWFHGKEKR
jgi:predicted ABC-type ATPase